MQHQAEASARVRAALRRPWVAALVVLAVYGVLAVLNSTGGYLGTDTGAKVITLDRMVEEGTSSPDVGYWAERWDPDGDYHPLFDTVRNDDGEWINVTTLPMLLAARPLYALGGYRLALLLPMLGAILAAFAARRIARRSGGDDAGWRAFWVVALASPVTVYALDLWEHSLGAGLMLCAVALLLRALDGRGWAWSATAAGACLGAAAAMRAEALVVTFVAVAATCVAVLLRRQVVRSALIGAACVAGFAAPWFANAWLEATLGGNSRTSRVTGQAQREWWTELEERGEEALVTWFGMPNASFPASAVLGALTVGCLVGAVVLHRRDEPRAGRVLLAAAAVLYVVAFATGLGFVSGALVASPFAAVAFLGFGRRPIGAVLGVALAMTLLIWTFQLTGGAVPQWGGRYILVPTVLLTVLGVVVLGTEPEDRVPRIGVAALAVAVTCFGLVWLHERSHGVEEFFDDLAQRPEEVIISTNGFLVREAGPAYEHRRYLSVGRGADVEGAVRVAEASGAESFAVLTRRAAAPAVDAEVIGSERVELLGVPLWYHRFRLAS